MIRAFRVEAFGHTSIVFAENRGRATAQVARSAEDAGYYGLFKRARTRRAKEYDDLDLTCPALRSHKFMSYSEDYIKTAGRASSRAHAEEKAAHAARKATRGSE